MSVAGEPIAATRAQIAWCTRSECGLWDSASKSSSRASGEALRSARSPARASRARQSCVLPAMRRRHIASNRSLACSRAYPRCSRSNPRYARAGVTSIICSHVATARAVSPWRSRRSPRFRYAGHGRRVPLDGRLEPACRLGGVAPLLGLEADRVVEERKNHRRLRRRFSFCRLRSLRAARGASYASVHWCCSSCSFCRFTSA